MHLFQMMYLSLLRTCFGRSPDMTSFIATDNSTPFPNKHTCQSLLIESPSSASVSRLQLLRGLRLFLLPCGFQIRAWRVVLDAVFLRVYPIQSLFLRSICLTSGSCPALSHRSSLSDLLLPLDFVDASQSGVAECLDLLLHHLCCPPCLTSVKQD